MLQLFFDSLFDESRLLQLSLMAQRFLLLSLVDPLSKRIFRTSGQHLVHYRDQFDFFIAWNFLCFVVSHFHISVKIS